MVEKGEIPKVLCSYEYSNQARGRLQHEENHNIRHQQIYREKPKGNEAS